MDPFVLNRKSNGKTACFFLVSVATFTLCGCFGGPERVDSPGWEPEPLADAAMENDANGDGILNKEELDAMPGLKASMRAIDKDRDKQLSRDEIFDRLQLYKDLKGGAGPQRLKILVDGKPVEGAKVRMIPEPFLEGVIEMAEGVTQPNGEVFPIAEGVPGMRVGFYRIEVTGENIPAKFGSADTTPIGFEMSPVSDGFTPRTTFNLK